MIPEPMPLFILTGFLGSGKTTLLQRILRSANAKGTGVIINEFGEASLDHRILAHVAEVNTIIQSGCVCCTTRPELTRGLLEFLRQSLAGGVPRFRRLVIETSGLSDPASIIHTVQGHSVLREYFRVAGVIAVVDAVNGLHTFQNHSEFAKQVSVADTILITKTDVASPGEAAELNRKLRNINPLASIRDARSGGLDFAGLLSEQNMARVVEAPSAPVVSAHGATTFTLTYERPLDWSAFLIWSSMLLKNHGERVLRLKGIVDTGDGSPPIAVHGVQHIMHAPEHLPSWPDADRRSRIVFIVRDFEPHLIQKSLDAFLGFAAQRS